MTSKIAPYGNLRVVEISLMISLKTKTLHQTNRPKISWCRERDDLFKVSLRESIVDRFTGSLMRNATPPKLFSQAP